MTRQEQFLAKAEVAANVILTAGAVLTVYGGEFVLYLIAHLIKPPFGSSGRPVMEELLQSNDKRKLAVTLAKQFGVQIDPRNGQEVLADLRAHGIDAVRTVLPRLQVLFQEDAHGGAGNAIPSQIFALGGISNKLTLFCNEGGQPVTYESDEHGSGMRRASGSQATSISWRSGTRSRRGIALRPGSISWISSAGNLSMVQRYAHLTPERLAAAVERLVAPAVEQPSTQPVRAEQLGQNFEAAKAEIPEDSASRVESVT